MKLIHVLLFTSFCFPLFAADVVKISDGGRANCKNSVDYFRSQHTSPILINAREIENTDYYVTLNLKITRLKCIKKNNRYVWAINETPDQYKYSVHGGYQDISKKVHFLQITITDYYSNLLDQIELSPEKPVQTVQVKLDKSLLSINQFNDTNGKGKYFFDTSFQDRYNYTIDESIPTMGVTRFSGFRIFLD